MAGNQASNAYLDFDGHIHYHCDEHAANIAIDNLLANDGNNTSINRTIVGFDCEWNAFPNPSKVSLIQVCARADECHLFQLSAMNYRIPSALQTLILDSDWIKVGVSISGDIYKLQRDYGIAADSVVAGQRKSIVDLSSYANRVFGKANCWSLDGLSQFLLNRPIDKRIRLTDWVNPLSELQRKYAATDAFASYQIYRAIEQYEKLFC